MYGMDHKFLHTEIQDPTFDYQSSVIQTVLGSIRRYLQDNPKRLVGVYMVNNKNNKWEIHTFLSAIKITSLSSFPL